MAYYFNGTTSKLVLSGAVVTAVPLTLACFFKPAAIGSFMRMVEPGEVTGSNAFLLALSATGTVQGFTTASTSNNASTTEVAFLNAWQSAAMVTQAVNSRYAAYNGRLSAINSTTRTPAGINLFSIGVSSSGVTQFWSGLLAEVAVWQAALTPTELLSFNNGVPATRIRPESLLLYMPLSASMGTKDLGPQGYVLTNTACVPVADHPSIMRDAREEL